VQFAVRVQFEPGGQVIVTHWSPQFAVDAGLENFPPHAAATATTASRIDATNVRLTYMIASSPSRQTSRSASSRPTTI
jgi:hypothetical protein